MESSTISIGKALLERSAVNAKITDIVSRININGSKDITAENPHVLLEELHILEERHLKITNAITVANYKTLIKHGDCELRIIEVMEKIEYLTKKIKRYKDIIEETEKDTLKKSSRRRADYSYTAGADNKDVFVSVLDIADIRKEIEKLSRDKNALQVALQEANWVTKISY